MIPDAEQKRVKDHAGVRSSAKLETEVARVCEGGASETTPKIGELPVAEENERYERRCGTVWMGRRGGAAVGMEHAGRNQSAT